MLNSKPFYESKEFWFFVLVLAQAVAALFGFADFTPSDDQAEIIQIVIAAVGLVLRLFFTEKKLVLRQ